jgi:hypothetical protein
VRPVDVGKDVIAVAVRLPGDGPDGRRTVKRTFKAFYGVLAEAAQWLVHLLECGPLAGSFIPPAEIKAARDVLRYRTKVAQQRVSEIARLGNVLQEPGSRSTRWPAPLPPGPGGR